MQSLLQSTIKHTCVDSLSKLVLHNDLWMRFIWFVQMHKVYYIFAASCMYMCVHVCVCACYSVSLSVCLCVRTLYRQQGITAYLTQYSTRFGCCSGYTLSGNQECSGKYVQHLLTCMYCMAILYCSYTG